MGLDNDFLDMYLKHKQQNTKEIAGDYIKLKKLLCSKRNHQQREKKTYRIGKIFANHVSDKALVSKIII